MKKLASILGIGVISMAVAFAPAFAQQTQPQGPAGPTAIQPKSDVKTQAANQTGKDEKNLPAKPGSDTQGKQPASAKPGPDLKATAPAPGKTGTDLKNEGTSGKPATDVKASSTPTKTDTGAKDQKGTNVKPGASLKSDKPVKSASHAKAVEKSKHNEKKSSVKVASMMHAKTHVSHLDNRTKATKSENTAPSTGK